MFIEGTSGFDQLFGTTGDDQIYGYAATDYIWASTGTDYIDGGDGRDRLNVYIGNTDLFPSQPTGSRTYTITSTSIADSSGSLNTTFAPFEELIFDARHAGDFGDMIDASGFVTSSSPWSSPVKMFLWLGNGNDTVIGNPESSRIYAGRGNHTIDAGAGHDEVVVITENSSAFIYYVTVSGGVLQTVQNGITTNSISNAEIVGIDHSNLTATQTRVDGSAVAGITVTLEFYDTNGTNISIGHDGVDYFVNNTDNVLGNDVYTGNGGADVYDYTLAVNAMDGDTITDFDADDVIDLQFNYEAVGADYTADKFIGTAAFSGVIGQYRYAIVGNQTLVRVDKDGNGVADETLTLSNGGFALAETFAGSNILQMAGNRVTGTAASETLHGTAGTDLIDGLAGADVMRLEHGGSDRAWGGDGNDGFYFGAALGSGDFADGGAGSDDQIGLQGNYAGLILNAANFPGIETFSLLPGNLTTFGDSGTSFYDYNITTAGSFGRNVIVSANRLRAGEDFTFNGSAETTGSFTFFGGFGTENLTGGNGSDGFYFGPDGRFGAGDMVNGGGGSDNQLGLHGDYTVNFNAAGFTNALTNIQTIALLSDTNPPFAGVGDGEFDYAITLSDGLVAAGQQLTVTGTRLTSAETMVVDGSAETNGTLRLFGGAAADTLTGGAGADIISGGLGADSLRGNGGADQFLYADVAHSAGARDWILDFVAGSDTINLGTIDADTTASGPGNEAFAFIGAQAFSGTAGQLRAVQFDAINNYWLVQGDVNGDGIADFALDVALVAGQLTSGDFLL